MEENKVCGLCGKDVPEESLYNEVTHHGKKTTLCRDCNKAVSTALSTDSSDEKAAARKELESLIQGEAASPTAVSYIREEVFGQKTKENGDPEEEAEEEIKSPYSMYVKFLAWIAWMAGLCIAILSANVPTSVGLFSILESKFSIEAFLMELIPFLVYGTLLMGLATVMDKAADTNKKVNELLILQKDRDQ